MKSVIKVIFTLMFFNKINNLVYVPIETKNLLENSEEIKQRNLSQNSENFVVENLNKITVEKEERKLNQIEELKKENETPENKETDIKIIKEDKKERNLSQISVIENSDEKNENKNENKKEAKIDLHSMFLNNVDDLIKNYGINKKIDKKQIDNYFDGLENKLFNNMKKKFLGNKKYKKRYNKINRVYRKLKEEYNIE